MEINIIAAVAANRAIGYQNDMVYFIREDLKRFKQLTTGHTVIMGRKTFHSLPKGALPNRRNIVLSRTETDFPNCDVYSSLEEYNDGIWVVESREEHPATDDNPAYAFVNYVRK